MAMDMNVALKINAGVTGQQSVDQLRTGMDKLNGAAGSVSKGFGLASIAVKGFLALQAVRAVSNMGLAVINVADQLDEMSERTGVAVETLSELQFAAKLNGRSLEDVQNALTRVAVKATEAATGNKTSALAFDALSVSVKNADGSMRTSLDITEDIGAAFRDITDPTLKAALAVEFFGRQGPLLVPLIEKMEETRQEARNLGGVIGADFAANSAEFNDNIDKMTFMAQGFAAAIMKEVVPSMTGMFKEFQVGMKVFGSFSSALYNIGNTNPFKTPAKQAEAYTQEVADLSASIKELDATGNWYDRRNANRMRGELETAQKLAQYFREIAGIKEVGGGRGFVNPEMPKTAQPDSAAILAKLAGSKAAEEAEKAATKAAEERIQVLKTLSDEVVKLTYGEEALTLAKLRDLGATPKQIEQAQQLMRERAGLKASDREMDEAIKENTKLTEDATRAKERLAEAGKRLFEETRTPSEKLNIELARLNDLLGRGAINWDVYSRAVFNAQDEFDALSVKGKDSMQELKDAVDGWGRQATDAFVDFAFGAKASFGDMVSSILKDIARMVMQTLLMAPLMAAIKGFLPTAFAGGGVMTGDGPAPLKKYANGGIANTPQLALFGEGSMPEAYVPLPDGRTIPVTMEGGGGGGTNNVTVNVSVESGGTDATATASGAAQLGKAIAGAVRMELMNQKRPGGLLAA